MRVEQFYGILTIFVGLHLTSGNQNRNHEFPSANNGHDFVYGPYFTTPGTTATKIVHPPTASVARPCPIMNPVTETRLNFAELGLKRIRTDFVDSQSTIELNLLGNEIEEIFGAAFRKVPRLQALDLSFNKIAIRKLLWYDHLTQLRLLKLDGNRGDNKTFTIPETYFEKLPYLKELSLRNNSILNFDVPLKELTPILQHLYLSANNLSGIDFLKRLPASLVTLHLDDNLLDEMTTAGLPNVVDLNLSGNKIQRVCNYCENRGLSLEDAPKLRTLRLSRNKITDVIDAFVNVANLKYLDLSHNEISHFDDRTFTNLWQIETLLINHNLLTAIPNVCGMESLNTLNVGSNKISSVRGNALCRLNKLSTVDLSGNQILTVESDAFDSLIWLQELDLSDNLLVNLSPYWTAGTRSIRIINLKNNRISSLEKMEFSNLTKLEELHLEGNPLPFVKILSIRTYAPDLKVHIQEQRAQSEDEEKNYIYDSNNVDSDYE